MNRTGSTLINLDHDRSSSACCSVAPDNIDLWRPSIHYLMVLVDLAQTWGSYSEKPRLAKKAATSGVQTSSFHCDIDALAPRKSEVASYE